MPSLEPEQTRASKPKTRNGKIARLPYLERDMVNRMLRDNIPQAQIVDALVEHGIVVTERNVSNWKTPANDSLPNSLLKYYRMLSCEQFSVLARSND